MSDARDRPATPVTIAYIAESAGVSVPTVSKVINGRSGVAADTRARVEALVNRYGYRKSTPAQRSTTMELVFDELEHMWGSRSSAGCSGWPGRTGWVSC
ncbi:LacI family DNA-binding transcriptional regulator [Phytohabitans rumicis]|uniref:HTH lacI-type domain-containing protein n=1 Tax=Phytohabitans rumicis TaxID=1076125 RepID=A0A6V8LBS9_9ACTN|nr:helix-turn-helix domain-containing protein [Phytohabitans rumicis]GFJ93804.1 hypothetical protein Prum_074460 [Phytohabitans rumicis]